jgi:ATP-dependent DNA helicase RecQ
MQFEINLGQNNNAERIFINDATGAGVGYVYLTNQQTGVYNNPSADREFCMQIVNWLRDQLPFGEIQELHTIRTWLTETTLDNRQETGLEHKLAGLEPGHKGELIIPFINRYYSQRATPTRDFEFNPAHGQKLLATQAIQRIIQAKYSSDFQIISQLSAAVEQNHDYQTFLDSLNIPNKEFKTQLSNNENPLSLELQQAYYIPRAKDDTAKAIYRLTSIGVIDSYTIDYQNNLYTIRFTKKEPEEYYRSLEMLMARYTSRNLAATEITELKKNAAPAIIAGKATVLSKCLEKLTEFIYDKIQKKRLQAINDMVRLCQTTISIRDSQKQNEYIRDEIYYYFNARYSRRGNRESGVEASMPDDLANRLPPGEAIDKYIRLAEDDKTGEFISNIKHLRGSCMRMLRSNPEAFQFRILKSFALFILADTIPGLTDEAKDELVLGLIEWKKIENLDVPDLIKKFLEKIAGHIPGRNILNAFDDIEDRYYTIYYAGWLKDFSHRFTPKT